MAEPLDAALARVRAAVLDPSTLDRAVAAGRRRDAQPAWRKVELRYVDLKTGRQLQLTSYDGQQAHTRNEPMGEPASRAVEELLAEPFGNWHVESVEQTLQLRVTKKGDALVHTRRRTAEVTPDRVHDRGKRRLLDPADPVLHMIGISDHAGRIKPSKQAKYRQVEDFLRELDSALEAGLTARALEQPTPERPLRVVDLGCGNAYLTFTAFAYLHGVRDLPLQMVGVDVKAQSRDRNNDLAEQLGWAERLSFVEASIAGVDLPDSPGIALALHACDTATDEALARAVRWQTPVVLAAPCCHHDLQAQLKNTQAPAPYGLLAQHGILRERWADLLTDTLRSAILRQYGYRVEAVEFVESVHTPRNVLLRAVRTGAAPSADTQREYAELVAGWGVEPALARMLDPA